MLGLLLVVILLYFPLNQPWGTVHLLQLPIDFHIPEVPVFVVPYVLNFYLLLIAVPIAMLKTPGRRFWRLTISLLAAQLIADLVYRFFQTTVPRPDSTPGGFFGSWLMAVRGADDPFSAFPSSHTFLTTIITWHLWGVVSRRMRPLLILNAALIIAATVLLRQHFVADIYAGLVLAVAVCSAVDGLVPDTPTSATPRVDPQRGVRAGNGSR